MLSRNDGALAPRVVWTHPRKVFNSPVTQATTAPTTNKLKKINYWWPYPIHTKKKPYVWLMADTLLRAFGAQGSDGSATEPVAGGGTCMGALGLGIEMKGYS